MPVSPSRPRTLTLAAMRAHVNGRIAAENAWRRPDDALRVKWITDRNSVRAVTGKEFNELQLPIINNARDYATALHELGHLLGRYQTSRDTLTRERWAWEWARTRAMQWTEEMKAEAMAALAALPRRKRPRKTRASRIGRGWPVLPQEVASRRNR